MKTNLNLYYDEEGDFLEISMGKYSEGYFKNLGNDIFERIDKKTKKTTGVAVFNFKKRTEKLDDINVELPFKIQLISKKSVKA